VTGPAAGELFAALEATWPARSRERVGPWVIRDGAGGGSRVSAATAEGPVAPGDVAGVVAAMAAHGQPPLVQVRNGQADLDALLAALGWRIADPTLVLAVPCGTRATADPAHEGGTIWPPDATARRLWDALGIGTTRQAVMDRVIVPKTVLVARIDGKPAGLAFVAVAGPVGMVHAMAVDPAFRRRGLARRILASAGDWARSQGARTVALAVTEQNVAARALYTSAGFAPVTGYHYRVADGA
jgi:GNAT superfamily N-acetyltransferase